MRRTWHQRGPACCVAKRGSRRCPCRRAVLLAAALLACMLAGWHVLACMPAAAWHKRKQGLPDQACRVCCLQQLGVGHADQLPLCWPLQATANLATTIIGAGGWCAGRFAGGGSGGRSSWRGQRHVQRSACPLRHCGHPLWAGLAPHVLPRTDATCSPLVPTRQASWRSPARLPPWASCLAWAAWLACLCCPSSR